MIGSAMIAEAGEIDENCLNERDVIFYKSVATETQIILTQGMFAVLFPWDVHRPNCNVGEKTANVRKILVKVRMDVLGS